MRKILMFVVAALMCSTASAYRKSGEGKPTFEITFPPEVEESTFWYEGDGMAMDCYLDWSNLPLPPFQSTPTAYAFTFVYRDSEDGKDPAPWGATIDSAGLGFSDFTTTTGTSRSLFQFPGHEWCPHMKADETISFWTVRVEVWYLDWNDEWQYTSVMNNFALVKGTRP